MMTECASYGGRQVLPVKNFIPVFEHMKQWGDENLGGWIISALHKIVSELVGREQYPFSKGRGSFCTNQLVIVMEA